VNRNKTKYETKAAVFEVSLELFLP
jgi:hypothetical protein